MKLIYLKGVPHWTDGGLALPVMAGGQKPPWEEDDAEPLPVGPAPQDTGFRDLQAYVGRFLIDPLSGKSGILSGPDRRGLYFFTNDSGQRSGTVQRGTNLLDPANRAFLAIGETYRDTRVSTASEDDLARYGFGTTNGGSTRNYAAEQAAADAAQAKRDADQRAWQTEQDRLNREFEAEQNRIAAEERRRSDLLGTADRLLEGRRKSRESAVGRASEQAGADTFRFLANVKGQQVAPGTMTPTDIFKAGNAQIAGFQAPTITPNATIGDLESAIAKMQAQDTAEAGFGGNVGPFTGFAMGGQMGKGGAQFGTSKTAVIVGDARINGDEEVVIHDRMSGQTEVIPLSGRAQAGATLTPNLTVLPQLFQTLRQNVGSFGGGQNNLSSQGYLSPAQSAAQAPAQLGSRGALATPLSLKQGLTEFLDPETGLAKYTPEEAQQLSDLIGVLPAPHKAAAFWRNLLPAEQEALKSAYKLAGFPTADLEAIAGESVIRGPAATGVSLR